MPSYAECYSNIKENPNYSLKAIQFDCGERTEMDGHKKS